MGTMDISTILVAISVAIVLKIYLILTAGKCRCKTSLEGKTVIVTGANRGIGFETAKDLAKRKAKVILACRSLDKGQKAVEDIMSDSKNENVIVKQLDLASLTSIRKFAEDVLKNEERLDILINNAGVGPPPGKHITEDKLELQFATNHFGPFLLTLLLLPLLKKSSPSRIIVVTSLLHILATLNLDNLNCEKYIRDPFWIYCDTKLANILFTRELSKKLDGTGVTVNCLHPGGVKTEIAKDGHWILRYLVKPVVFPFFKDVKSGAQTSIYLAVSEDVKYTSGQYFSDCQPTWISPKAKDNELAAKLWKLSEALTNESY